MKATRLTGVLLGFGALAMSAPAALPADLPEYFDLRDFDGVNYVTSVKSQEGGTCWTHGAMAAIEGNLLMTGRWQIAGEIGEPNLAEYHLDWWNGFNQHCNDDDPGGGGLVVHQGGDYRVTSAYLTRCEGAVRDIDGQSYGSPPARFDPDFHCYYPRDIEWYVAGEDLSNIDLIKTKLMERGVIGTCMAYSSVFISDFVHYQPRSSTMLPNHAVAIVGWDDNKITQAPEGPGAWIVKNSWGADWGIDGYFWISYYDKWSCQEPEMGAVSFQDVEPLAYDRAYYHDYHGWRDTMSDCTEAFNKFIGQGGFEYAEVIQAVSFFTATENVTYTVTIYDDFESGELQNELASQTGLIEHSGFHTVDLDSPVIPEMGDDFFVYLYLSEGGQPYDRTSDVPVLLGASYRVIVNSAANPDESYYRSGGQWLDLYDYSDPPWDHSLNFCMKALSADVPPLYVAFADELPALVPPGEPIVLTVSVAPGTEDVMTGGAFIAWRYDPLDEWSFEPLAPIGDDLFEATLPATACGYQPQFYAVAEGSGGSYMADPPDAPDSFYAAEVGIEVMIWTDDFNADQGWTVENSAGLTDGAWERAIPAGGGDRGDPPSDYDGSGFCFVTDNADDNSDVDGGYTWLISPPLDLSDGDAFIHYALWYSNNYGGDPHNDIFKIWVSDDDGGSWVLAEEVGPITINEWGERAFRVGAFVTPSSTVRVRFEASDLGIASVVEAGVDAFSITRIECEGGCSEDVNGDLVVDIFDLLAVLAAWGDTGDVPEDVNEDGLVNIFDLLAVLAAWGPCE